MKKKIFLTLALLSTLGFAANNRNQGTITGKLKYKIAASGQERVIIINHKGKVVWEYPATNVNDLTMLPNGNILFGEGKSITEVNRAKKVVFSYVSDAGKHTKEGTFFAQRLANGNTVISENAKSRVIEVNRKGKIVFVLDLTKTNPNPGHHNLRMARKLANGNYLVCHSGKHLVREYTPKGKVVWEKKAKGLAFAAVRLKNGNTMISSLNQITEYNKAGKEVWEFKNTDLADHTITNMTGMHVLKNGNVVIGCYAAYKKGKGFGCFEITKAKKLVWGYSNPKGDFYQMGAQLLNTRKPLVNIIH
ncbi:MAG: aryl-sulfate sulfotransferase [Lentisphaeria bacterium]|nr:aryl-sulfate sulfotransferase [Lentisphaeria bacterium]